MYQAISYMLDLNLRHVGTLSDTSLTSLMYHQNSQHLQWAFYTSHYTWRGSSLSYVVGVNWVKTCKCYDQMVFSLAERLQSYSWLLGVKGNIRNSNIRSPVQYSFYTDYSEKNIWLVIKAGYTLKKDIDIISTPGPVFKVVSCHLYTWNLEFTAARYANFLKVSYQLLHIFGSWRYIT